MAGAQGKLEELRKRVLFTLFILGVFRIATQVPTPGVDSSALTSFFEGMQGSVFGVFNNFTGGALERFSVLALGIMPYITSSIIFSLLTVSFPALGEIQKEPDGHKKIQQWTRYATVLLCVIQGYGLAVGLEALKSPSGMPIVLEPGMGFRGLTVISLTAGTMFVMWLGEQITERGIGNGISLIIFAGIAAGIPSGIRDTLNLFQNGELSGLNLGLVAAIMFVSFWIIIYTEKAFRKIPVQYAKRVVNNRVFGGQSSHLPVKINISGVMPPIFASALLGFPTTVSQFIPEGSGMKMYFDTIQQSLYPGKTLYNVVFVALIIFFCYFYAQIQFKTKDISESLKKNGGFIPGIRPGEKTAEFLDNVVNRLTLVGGVYISIICIMPAILFNVAKVPFYFGGTSLLILVGVAIDTMAQAESFMISQRYDTAYKSRGKYSGARRF
ncbi:MAG: preprotein translocase subunit SecY [Nocardioides sp.]|nr:preprotein translocase subunit SecY [Halobacteriovoraceae bacterium]MBS45533.1 preprotein translocase subunit SecY [Nocardioides sp.]|tara:strand:- start:7809 stop:9128 length:1320 start_codon:yes stop_codon:yes gene_type:complete